MPYSKEQNLYNALIEWDLKPMKHDDEKGVALKTGFKLSL